ncbi:MAG: glycosyltransferase family 4 protein [Longimicrobiales bacterium]
MSPPRLFVVAGGTRTTASTRHRLWNYRPFLEADGVEMDWIEYGGGRESSALRAALLRIRFLKDLVVRGGGADVILVQKVLPPAALVRRWRAGGARVVYDFDDALYHQALWGETEAQAARRRSRFDAMLELADVVVAGSPPLAEYARTRAGRVEVLYPSLQRGRFEGTTRPPRDPGSVTVGWVGNDQSQIYLKALEPVLAEAFDRHPSARLTVCSSSAPDLAPSVAGRMTFVPWSESAELEAAASFDLAISPLGPEPWSRARGGRVSVLLSMASGVAVVASPGGGIEELVDDSEAVLFADDPDTWARQLDRLLASAGERERVGAAARGVVARKIWADVQYPRLRDILFP